jgi:hypothetical protein
MHGHQEYPSRTAGGAAGAGLFAAIAAGLLAMFPWADKKSRTVESPDGEAEKEKTKPS